MSGITYLYLQNCGVTFIVPLVAKITLEGNFVENPLFFFVSGIMVTACCLVKFYLILENIKKALIERGSIIFNNCETNTTGSK